MLPIVKQPGEEPERKIEPCDFNFPIPITDRLTAPRGRLRGYG